MKTKKSYLNSIRWIARISGSILFAFTILFLSMEFMGSLRENAGAANSHLSTIIIVSFIIWGLALSGLVVALWKEGLGGFISLVGFIILCILNFFNPEASKSIVTVIMFLLWMIPSMLYIYYWKKSKDHPYADY